MCIRDSYVLIEKEKKIWYSGYKKPESGNPVTGIRISGIVKIIMPLKMDKLLLQTFCSKTIISIFSNFLQFYDNQGFWAITSSIINLLQWFFDMLGVDMLVKLHINDILSWTLYILLKFDIFTVRKKVVHPVVCFKNIHDIFFNRH